MCIALFVFKPYYWGMSFKHIIGNRIAKERKRKNLSREDLADSTTLHLNLIGRIERGETNTGYENIYKICKALDIKITDLFNGY